MFYVLLTKWDDRVSSVLQAEEGVLNAWDFDDASDYRMVVLQDAEIDYSKDLADYRYDGESRSLVYDPIAEEASYTDLSTGETVTMTQAELDEMVAGLVEERVQANVEAIAAEMAERLRAEGLVIPGQGA